MFEAMQQAQKENNNKKQYKEEKILNVGTLSLKIELPESLSNEFSKTDFNETASEIQYKLEMNNSKDKSSDLNANSSCQKTSTEKGEVIITEIKLEKEEEDLDSLRIKLQSFALNMVYKDKWVNASCGSSDLYLNRPINLKMRHKSSPDLRMLPSSLPSTPPTSPQPKDLIRIRGKNSMDNICRKSTKLNKNGSLGEKAINSIDVDRSPIKEKYLHFNTILRKENLSIRNIKRKRKSQPLSPQQRKDCRSKVDDSKEMGNINNKRTSTNTEIIVESDTTIEEKDGTRDHIISIDSEKVVKESSPKKNTEKNISSVKILEASKKQTVEELISNLGKRKISESISTHTCILDPNLLSIKQLCAEKRLKNQAPSMA